MVPARPARSVVAPAGGGVVGVRSAGAVGLLATLLMLGTACGSSEPPCPSSAEGTLVEGAAHPTCAEAEQAVTYVEALSSRPLTKTQRDRLLGALRDRAETDAAAVTGVLSRAQAFVTTLEGTADPMARAVARSQHAFEATRGGGVFPEADWPDVAAVLSASVAVWGRSEATNLVLTEMDVEGWIRYGSLCREVQGASPLRFSVADRVGIYRMVEDRFDELDADGQRAMIAVGPYWRSVQHRWAAASYSTQQAWKDAAPLPPPMTATSLGYLEAIVAGDVEGHARALHAELGPLVLDHQAR